MTSIMNDIVKKSISVVIPVYNGRKYLPEALESVCKQTLPATEIIIVNDGSTDGTAEYIDGLADERIIVLHRKRNSGQAAARNLGIEKSQGEYIALLDCDDLWEEEKLELQTATMISENADIVTTCFNEFFSPDISPETRSTTRLKEGPLTGPNNSNLLVRREVFHKTGLFNPAWRTGELLDWWSRVVEQKITHVEIDRILVRRRVHDHNLGRTAARDRKDYLAIVRQAMARKRAATGAKPTEDSHPS
jgi:glycosyltransferase involved in cell wall biosynthesis